MSIQLGHRAGRVHSRLERENDCTVTRRVLQTGPKSLSTQCECARVCVHGKVYDIYLTHPCCCDEPNHNAGPGTHEPDHSPTTCCVCMIVCSCVRAVDTCKRTATLAVRAITSSRPLCCFDNWFRTTQQYLLRSVSQLSPNTMLHRDERRTFLSSKFNAQHTRL